MHHGGTPVATLIFVRILALDRTQRVKHAMMTAQATFVYAKVALAAILLLTPLQALAARRLSLPLPISVPVLLQWPSTLLRSIIRQLATSVLSAVVRLMTKGTRLVVISISVKITAQDPTRKGCGVWTTMLAVQMAPTVLVGEVVAHCIALLQVQTENGAMRVSSVPDLAAANQEFAATRLLVRTMAVNATPAKTISVTVGTHHCTQM